ncbi:MAG TPA: tRNA (N6-isopentenyl adenosine(37)-C2)-methylthiotransferase MiaB [Bacteroidales bacterium]|nr:tRNA (N6-isopentenyl adenosine(37)-C2)-methylthiotransferase MiaB [Bacteroidales bacterium]
MPKTYYIETYGCQMNVADSEVVASVLADAGYLPVREITQADIILVNTCSIRENAEQRVWGRLDLFRAQKKKRPQVIVGVLGCMAERLKEKLLESNKMVDMVIGPDAYRDLPMLVETAATGHAAVNVLLSREETYADIAPVRLESNGVSAFISIMRGCNNMCAYCVVPYVRGAERSRDPETIVREAREAFDQGFREVTLLGQNVNSYSWEYGSSPIGFAELLGMVATVDPQLRVRYSTSHPKDLSDDVLEAMAEHENICRHIHLPVQSGSSSVLKRMNRNYTREWYLDRIAAINRILPGCALSTDIITGFCGETEEEHRETLSLMQEVGFDFAYMFKYSERPGTKASRHMKDDVPDEVKTRRLNEIIALQNELSAVSKKADTGRTFEVLVEGPAKKPAGAMMGRTSGNKVVVFQASDILPGDYVNVTITRSTSATLIGTLTP